MFIFAIDCLLFLFIITPGTSSGIHWTWSAINTIAYLLLSIGVALVCLKATITDPTDQNVLFERRMKAMGKEVLDTDEYDFFCDVCDAYVSD